MPQGSVIYKERSWQTEIYIIVKGAALNKITHKKFSEGSVIGINDAIKKRLCTSTFVALTDIHLMKIDKDTFF
jgi:CRP-like cAMP-binding protein